jgi:hypothetical protein
MREKATVDDDPRHEVYVHDIMMMMMVGDGVGERKESIKVMIINGDMMGTPPFIEIND